MTRYVGEIGWQFSGDKARAQQLTGVARKVVGQLDSYTGGIEQKSRTVMLPDGSTISVWKRNGIVRCKINVRPGGDDGGKVVTDSSLFVFTGYTGKTWSRTIKTENETATASPVGMTPDAAVVESPTLNGLEGGAFPEYQTLTAFEWRGDGYELYTHYSAPYLVRYLTFDVAYGDKKIWYRGKVIYTAPTDIMGFGVFKSRLIVVLKYVNYDGFTVNSYAFDPLNPGIPIGAALETLLTVSGQPVKHNSSDLVFKFSPDGSKAVRLSHSGFNVNPSWIDWLNLSLEDDGSITCAFSTEATSYLCRSSFSRSIAPSDCTYTAEVTAQWGSASGPYSPSKLTDCNGTWKPYGLSHNVTTYYASVQNRLAGSVSNTTIIYASLLAVDFTADGRFVYAALEPNSSGTSTTSVAHTANSSGCFGCHPDVVEVTTDESMSEVKDVNITRNLGVYIGGSKVGSVIFDVRKDIKQYACTKNRGGTGDAFMPNILYSGTIDQKNSADFATINVVADLDLRYGVVLEQQNESTSVVNSHASGDSRIQTLTITGSASSSSGYRDMVIRYLGYGKYPNSAKVFTAPAYLDIDAEDLSVAGFDAEDYNAAPYKLIVNDPPTSTGGFARYTPVQFYRESRMAVSPTGAVAFSLEFTDTTGNLSSVHPYIYSPKTNKVIDVAASLGLTCSGLTMVSAIHCISDEKMPKQAETA